MSLPANATEKATGDPPPQNQNLPLRPALRNGSASMGMGDNKEGNRSVESLALNGTPKAVSISNEPTDIPNLPPPPSTPNTPDSAGRPKQFKTNISSQRMTGRPVPPVATSSSRLSLLSQSSIEDNSSPVPAASVTEGSTPLNGLVGGKNGERERGERERGERKHGHLHELRHGLHNLVSGRKGGEEREGRGDGIAEEGRVLGQVFEWLQAEKARRGRREREREGRGEVSAGEGERERRGSASSDSSAVRLEKLQRILEDGMGSLGLSVEGGGAVGSPVLSPRRPSHLSSRRRSNARKLGAASSDTEYQDGDVVVPTCDVVLDNSKTMSYTGGASESSNETVTLSTSKRAEKEKKAWHKFKSEIVTLAHTLRLKGWRRVPLERGGDIEVERLSGALTNAVYVVSPPKDLPLMTSDTNPKPHQPRPPPKLLLRIYGPQVEHLIDRENELNILRRLSRKKIGPRLLGTFKNGRFEEFLNAQTLCAQDLRIEDTSKQIAKRMRELHDGIDLLEREREEGPFVWRNWDKWVDHCETVIRYLDKEILSGEKGKGEKWRERGLVCGVEWKYFRGAVDRFREWLGVYYGKEGVERHLVFAHNDTQYGNILRLIPEPPSQGSAPSPLLLPQNTHKQLVVIDFEYASANTPGLEFANHFTEWCYNYHDPSFPWKCKTENYPTKEQQERFIKSYVNHRPQFNPRASATPKMNALDGVSKGSISEFLLDSRTPGGSEGVGGGVEVGKYDYKEEEAQRERETEKRVKQLLKETRIWRVANSAQWVAWGIVQAKVPELSSPSNSLGPSSPILEGETVASPQPIEEVGSKDTVSSPAPAVPITNQTPTIPQTPKSPSLDHLPENSYNRHDKRPEGLKAEALLSGSSEKDLEALEGGEEEEEFDYLAYAQDRAMFFWGDVLGLGIVGREELRGWGLDVSDGAGELGGRIRVLDC